MNFICFGGKVNVSTLNIGNWWEIVVSVNTEGFDRAVDVFQVLRERGFNEYDTVDSGKTKVFTKRVDVEERVEIATNLSVEITKEIRGKKAVQMETTDGILNIYFV
jgi:hypothetical protein